MNSIGFFSSNNQETTLWTPSILIPYAWASTDNPDNVINTGVFTSLADKSGNGRVFSARGQPVVVTNAINGLTCTRLDNVGGDGFQITNSSDLGKNIGSMSVAVVYKNDPVQVSVGERLLFFLETVDRDTTRFGLASCNGLTLNTPRIGGRRVDGTSIQSVHASLSKTDSTIVIGSIDYKNGDAFIRTDGSMDGYSTTFLTDGLTSNTNSYSDAWVGRTNPTTTNYLGHEGLIGEIVVINRLLSTDESLRLEGYLAHKWGLTSSLPDSHPYKAFPPVIQASTSWTPTGLSTLPKIWLNDQSNVINVSGTCSKWDDISGNNYHMTQSSSPSRPLILSTTQNNLRVIRFDGIDDIMLVTASSGSGIFKNTAKGWGLVLYKKNSTDGAASTRTLFNATNGTDNSSRFVMDHQYVGSSIDKPAITVRRLDADSTSILTANTAIAKRWGALLQILDWSEGDGTIYIDGFKDIENLALTTSGYTSATDSVKNLGLGGYSADGNTTNWIDADIGEVLIGSDTSPTLMEINRLFGYLAHKWGVSSTLLPNHPYKYFAPIVTSLQPETEIWLNRIKATGGYVSQYEISLIDALATKINSETFASKIIYMLPFVGNNIRAQCVPLFDKLNVGPADNYGFVDTDCKTSRGLSNIGTVSKYLDTKIKPSQLGSNNNGGLGWWELDMQYGANPEPIGVYSSTNSPDQRFLLDLRSTLQYFRWGGVTNSQAGVSTRSSNGFYYGQRSSSILRRIYKNGNPLGTDGTASDAAVGANEQAIVMFGARSNSPLGY